MTSPKDIVIVNPLRTPVGRYGGQFAQIPVQDLAVCVIKEIIARTGISGSDIDDIILGQASPNGAAPALGRIVALDAGLDVTVPGMQLDRRCGSGLQAIATAAAHIASGAADLIIAGGAESMSRTEYTVDSDVRWGTKGGNLEFKDRLAEARVTAGGKHHPIPGGMIETAENLAREFHIERETQDHLAVTSHERAVAAQESGVFAEEIVPVTVPGRRRNDPGEEITTDEHPRPGTSVEKLARLRAIMPDGSVTAGNASGQNDGAAAMIVCTRAKAEELGLTPTARLVGWAVAGVAPETMGTGPVPATRKVLDRLGLTLADIDVIELNEAFAAQALAVLHELEISPEDPRLNPHGSGISLGHPVGATGARMVVTLAHELRRRQARYGLATMCIGGGQGLAAVFESETN
ncbi:acetyl-CoA C-acetyltransferase [Corynebacterium hindlerae]|uniref:acetyl-CoA C-acetyltransferase n=1 Tax=Corynebacterium hindlerae TaxID=699041 RepID=UPI001AD67081|nr:acetyl-CoA C-acetyltransferase [Corynebacterium hindlerae]QTH59718.1 acetyl-CoA C-acetyltransferase [Corynebacterium hindlerae]